MPLQTQPPTTCSQCGSTLVERQGKYGKFWGCSNYPGCKYTWRPPSKAQLNHEEAMDLLRIINEKLNQILGKKEEDRKDILEKNLKVDAQETQPQPTELVQQPQSPIAHPSEDEINAQFQEVGNS